MFCNNVCIIFGCTKCGESHIILVPEVDKQFLALFHTCNLFGRPMHYKSKIIANRQVWYDIGIKLF